MQPTPVGSVSTLRRGDSVSFCNLATRPGSSFKGWGPRDVFLSDLLFFFHLGFFFSPRFDVVFTAKSDNSN